MSISTLDWVFLNQRLKQKFCLCRLIDCYATNPGSLANYHESHKIAFSLWWKWTTKTVECEILAIKKLLLWKLYKFDYIHFF